MRRTLSFVAAVLVALALMTAAFAIGKGDRAPEFKLKAINGKTVSLSDLRKGTTKLVVIDFWATNCPPCVAEIPHLQKLYQKYNKRGLVMVGISGYRGDTIEDVKSFVKDNKMTYPIPYDPGRKVLMKYGVRGLPTLFMIDKQGIIRNVEIGYTPPEILESEIKALLK